MLVERLRVVVSCEGMSWVVHGFGYWVRRDEVPAMVSACGVLG